MVTLQAALAAMVLAGTGQTALLDFYTDWCGSCKAMNPAIQRLEKAGYPIQRVNAEQNRTLAAKYGINSYPTFVMVVDGKEVDRVVGGTSDYRLEQMCKRGAAAAASERSPTMLAQNGPPAARPAAPAVPGSWSPPDGRAMPPTTAQPISMPARPVAAVSDAALLAASVRLQVEDPSGRSCGSGTIIDARDGRAMVLTCGHIFRDSKGKGRITVDLYGPNGVQHVPGQWWDYDLERDVGLVWFYAPGPVAVARVAPPGYHVERGIAPVVSVGCNNGDPPTARRSQVTSLDKFLGPPNIQVAGQPVEGRSGGGLFSSEGYVIGVCNAADPSDKEGFFAALDSIYAKLDAAKLSCVYNTPSGSLGVSPEAAVPTGTLASASPLIARPMPGPIDLASARSAPSADGPSGLARHEQAALEEIQRRVKEGAVVTCVIHSRDNPTGKSDVIMLDRASPEFVKLLTTDSRPQNRRFETSLELPGPRKKLLEWSIDGKADGGGWKAEATSAEGR